MKAFVKILVATAALLMVGAVSYSCKKDSKEEKDKTPVPCFVYADNTSKPMPDELQISIKADYEPRFVPSDGTKPILYDNTHNINFVFDGAKTGHDMFAYAGMSASKHGLEGWEFGFGARKTGAKAAKVGDVDYVTITYDHDGVVIYKRVKLTAVD